MDLTGPRGAGAAGGGGAESGGGGARRERCGHGKQRGKCRECRGERAAGGAALEEQAAHEEVEPAGAGEGARDRQRQTGSAPQRGQSRCEHNRQKNNCKDCGGTSICQHNRQRSRCKDCGGASICQHNDDDVCLLVLIQ